MVFTFPEQVRRPLRVSVHMGKTQECSVEQGPELTNQAVQRCHPARRQVGIVFFDGWNIIWFDLCRPPEK